MAKSVSQTRLSTTLISSVVKGWTGNAGAEVDDKAVVDAGSLDKPKDTPSILELKEPKDGQAMPELK